MRWRKRSGRVTGSPCPLARPTWSAWPSISSPSCIGCGEFAKAEQAYRQASRFGRRPQPGLAQLRLAQGQVDAAMAAIRTALDEAPNRLARSKLLAAYVDIVLAATDVPSARAAADELAEIAAELEAPLLRAVAARATGAVLLAEGDLRAALTALRDAWAAWQELGAPYESGRVRVLVGLVCRALHDEDTAAMELDAARRDPLTRYLESPIPPLPGVLGGFPEAATSPAVIASQQAS